MHFDIGILRVLAPLALLSTLGTGCSDIKDIYNALSDDYFVKLDKDPAQVASAATQLSKTFNFDLIHVYDSVNEGFAVRLPEELAKELRGADGVDYVKLVDNIGYISPDETPELVDPPASEIPGGIERIGGSGNLYDMSNMGIQVAVVDTGVDSSHPDLNVVEYVDFVCKSTPSDCADGGDPMGHGTHVAGTIGAIADGEGVVGVAPGVPIQAVRVLNKDGSGYWTDIIAGLEYVLDNPKIKVVNLSLGGDGTPDLSDEFAVALQRLEDAGVVVAIAAGNETENTNNKVPAGYDIGITVSAYDASGGRDNGFSWFSNYGDAVDIAAPGSSIKSTWPNGSYAKLDGTSMATPHVAGAAAVYMALNPGAGPNQVRNAMIDKGENNYSGQGGKHSEPLLDYERLTR